VWTKEDAPRRELIGQERSFRDQHYHDARREWIEGFMKWEAGTHPGLEHAVGTEMDWWEWYGYPPDRAYYRPWRDDEATWFQLWQNVSEGSPVSPPFATEEELIQYLAANGDFWDQKREKDWNVKPRPNGWGDAAARAFVNAGGAPSLMVKGGVMFDSRDIPLALKKEK
jgi:hypothetical protein